MRPWRAGRFGRRCSPSTRRGPRWREPGPPHGSFDGLRLPGLLSLLLIGLGFLGLDLPSWRGRGHGRLGRVGFDVAGLGMFAIVVSGASPPIRFHDLRHSCLSLLAQRG